MPRGRQARGPTIAPAASGRSEWPASTSRPRLPRAGQGPTPYQGGLVSDGRPMWSTDAVAIDTSSAVVDVGTLNMKPVRVAAFASDWDCGGQRVSIGQSGGVTRLVIGGESFDLRPVEAASGAKSEAAGDPTTHIWNKGDCALLVVRGKAYPECAPVAKLADVFRARGNEPDWQLGIGPQTMTLVAQDRQSRTTVAAPRPTVTDGATKYVAGSTALTVPVYDRPCVDSMSGMPHPKTVEVRHAGTRTLLGCAGEPADLLRSSLRRVLSASAR